MAYTPEEEQAFIAEKSAELKTLLSPPQVINLAEFQAKLTEYRQKINAGRKPGDGSPLALADKDIYERALINIVPELQIISNELTAAQPFLDSFEAKNLDQRPDPFIDLGKLVSDLKNTLGTNIDPDLKNAIDRAAQLYTLSLIRKNRAAFESKEPGRNFEIWNRYKAYRQERQAQGANFDANAYFAVVNAELTAAGWTSPDSQTLFESAYEIENKIIEARTNGLTLTQLQALETELRQFEVTTQTANTGISETAVLFNRLNEEFKDLSNKVVSGINAGFEDRVKNVMLEQEFREYQSFLANLKRLHRALQDARQRGLFTDPNGDIAGLLQKVEDGQRFLTDADVPPADQQQLTLLYDYVVAEATILVGEETQELPSVYTQDIIWWMEVNHDYSWRTTQKLFTQYELNNLRSFDATDRQTVENNINYFKRAIDLLDRSDLAYRQRLVALDIQLNRLLKIQGALEQLDEDDRNANPTVKNVELNLPEGVKVHGSFEHLTHVLEENLKGMIRRLVTVDFNAEYVDQNEVEGAYTTYSNLLTYHAENTHGFEALREIKPMVDVIVQMYTDGTMHKGTLKLDEVSVNWEMIKSKLGSGNAVERYDDFKELSLWKRVIGPLTRRAFMYMVDGKSEWAAGDTWSGRDHIEKLYERCHEELYFGFKAVAVNDAGGNLLGYKRKPFTSDQEKIDAVNSGLDLNLIFPPDPVYRAEIDRFPSVDGRFGRSDVINFAKEVAWYDSSLNDHRTFAAMIHLGILKKSFKHFTGQQPLDAVAGLLNGGYQNKNFDQGVWATLWGAIAEVPELIREGEFRLSDIFSEIPADSVLDRKFVAGEEYQREGHEKHFKDYERLVRLYFQWLFGKDWNEIYHKFKPRGMFLLPPMTGFLSAPLREDGTRDPSNTWDVYNKAGESTLWLLEKSTKCFSSDIDWKHNLVDDRLKMVSMGKELGTNLAIAFGWRWSFEYIEVPLTNLVDAQGNKIVTYDEHGIPQKVAANVPRAELINKAIDREIDQQEFLRSTAQFYLIYIMAQIPLSDLKRGLNPFDRDIKEYDEYIESFAKAVGDEYANNNTSFNIWSGFLKHAYHEIVHSHDFHKRLRLLPMMARENYWFNYDQIIEGKTPWQAAQETTDHKQAIPVFPFRKGESSDRGAREGGDKK